MCPTLLVQNIFRKVFSFDRVYKLPPEVARRATIAFLVAWNESLVFVNHRGIVTRNRGNILLRDLWLNFVGSPDWSVRPRDFMILLVAEQFENGSNLVESGKKHTGMKRSTTAYNYLLKSFKNRESHSNPNIFESSFGFSNDCIVPSR